MLLALKLSGTWHLNRVNVEFVQVISNDHLKMRVWERGLVKQMHVLVLVRVWLPDT